MECNPPAVMPASERSAAVMSAIATLGLTGGEVSPKDEEDHRRIISATPDATVGPARSQRLMLGAWETETLAAVAGVLCRDHPQLSTFEIVRLVCRVAQSELPSQGGIRLLHRVRQEIAVHHPSAESGGV